MYREKKPDIVNLLQTTELWFVLVANPDGYQYTFDYDRLWRKNLRDNDGDNQITPLDGVDPNRNFPEHWKFDDEGSASITSDETYRGPSARLRAGDPGVDRSLYNRVDFRFHVNYHSFGELLLYTFGFQVNSPSADDPIYVALSGTDQKPAIDGFNPGVGADLYTTNGETTDYAHAHGQVRWRGRPNSATGRTTTASCSLTKRVKSKASSRRTCPSPCRSPSRQSIPTTPCPTPRSRPSRSTSTSRTSTRRRAGTR